MRSVFVVVLLLLSAERSRTAPDFDYASAVASVRQIGTGTFAELADWADGFLSVELAAAAGPNSTTAQLPFSRYSATASLFMDDFDGMRGIGTRFALEPSDIFMLVPCGVAMGSEAALRDAVVGPALRRAALEEPPLTLSANVATAMLLAKEATALPKSRWRAFLKILPKPGTVMAPVADAFEAVADLRIRADGGGDDVTGEQIRRLALYEAALSLGGTEMRNQLQRVSNTRSEVNRLIRTYLVPEMLRGAPPTSEVAQLFEELARWALDVVHTRAWDIEVGSCSPVSPDGEGSETAEALAFARRHYREVSRASTLIPLADMVNMGRGDQGQVLLRMQDVEIDAATAGGAEPAQCVETAGEGAPSPPRCSGGSSVGFRGWFYKTRQARDVDEQVYNLYSAPGQGCNVALAALGGFSIDDPGLDCYHLEAQGSSEADPTEAVLRLGALFPAQVLRMFRRRAAATVDSACAASTRARLDAGDPLGLATELRALRLWRAGLMEVLRERRETTAAAESALAALSALLPSGALLDLARPQGVTVRALRAVARGEEAVLRAAVAEVDRRWLLALTLDSASPLGADGGGAVADGGGGGAIHGSAHYPPVELQLSLNEGPVTNVNVNGGKPAEESASDICALMLLPTSSASSDAATMMGNCVRVVASELRRKREEQRAPEWTAWLRRFLESETKIRAAPDEPMSDGAAPNDGPVCAELDGT